MANQPSQSNQPSQKEHPLLRLILSAATLIALVVMVVTLATKGTKNAISLEPDSKGIAIESTKLKAVRDIGQWEFLTLNDEELVDSTESRLLGDKKITRIYYGTMRLGIDMTQLDDNAVRMVGDTIDVKLPPVKLLDEDFIDETRTRPFYEKGSWNAKARKALFEKAKRQMTARCMTDDNIHIAQAYAIDEVSRVFESMGYLYVKVHF